MKDKHDICYNFQKYKMNENKIPMGLLANRDKLIELINRLLQDILNTTADLPKGNSKFHAKSKPSVAIQDYLTRLSKYAHCSTAAYVISLIYIDRLQDGFGDLVLNLFCIHKVLISSLVLAAKYNDDEYYKNGYYAKVGGISLQQMNALQFQFSRTLDYNFYVGAKQFANYLEKLGAYDDVKE